MTTDTGADMPAGKTAPARSPLAPERFPDLPTIGGVRFAATQAGVRYAGRTDLMLVHVAPGASIAGVFTRSSTRSAAVRDCQDKLAAMPRDAGAGMAIMVNSGNANTFTGARGAEDVARLSDAVATALDVPVGRVFTASTGVIGELLPRDRITAAIPALIQGLDADAAPDAARAIMTTDTFPKGAVAEVRIDGTPVRVMGIAKGSGMIAPDMATMLGFVFTDAAVAQPVLQAMLAAHTETTFNAVTVDSDTSTSDTVLLVATGASGAPVITDPDSPAGAAFSAALHGVLHDLALQLVRDGEGATKLVEVRVTGAATRDDARKVARSIANSPLVKTAIAGQDPNWGRIVMAVGKSGAEADRDRLSIRFGDILVAENGWVAPGYSEAEAAAYMRGQELVIAVDLGMGPGADTVWTCDLTHAYIDINADYRS